LPRRRKETIREFRRKIAKLKREGILSSKVDARKAKPSKHYKKIISRYRGILEDRQKTVKVTKKQAEVARESGLNVKGNRVVIDRVPGARVIKNKKDPFGYRIKFPNRVQEISFPPPKGETLEEYFNKLRKHAPKRGRIGFTINGHQSRASFSTIEQAEAFFLKYPSTQSILSGSGTSTEDELISLTTFYWTPDTRTKWKGSVSPKPKPPARCTSRKGKLRCKKLKGHIGKHIYAS